MGDSLLTYLHDHLAGADLGVGVLHSMQQRDREGSDDEFVARLMAEIEEDRATLREFAASLGSASSVVKEATAWVAEKATRVKLNLASPGVFGEFEALEILGTGIHGKLNLWRALQAASAGDTRLHSLDLDGLIVRAESQWKVVEERRIALAPRALAVTE